ncbi:MAG: MutS-related protein, partial [Planctomycetota bacterium]
LSTGRIAAFTAGAALTWWVFASAPAAWPAPVAAFVAFATLVFLHGRVRARLERARRAVALHERNLERLEDRWAGTGPTGAEDLPADHPYAADLDLFGEGSLFQLLCSARTRLGEHTLAGWLLRPAESPEIRARQQVVRELAPDVDVRERLALLGDAVHDDLDPEVLIAWTRRAPVGTRAWEQPIAVILGVLAAAAVVAWEGYGLGLGPLGIVVILELVFARSVKQRMAERTHGAEAAGKQLALLAGVLELIEARDARSGRLQELAGALRTGGLSPSRQAARFDRLVQSLLNSRLNAVYGLIAFLLQLNVHRACRIEAWRCRVGPSLPEWLRVAGEFEALCSLAAYAYEHPDHAFPQIVEAGARFDADQLGHPLIPAARCVRNDVRFDDERPLILLTGSNMSGKSTLLRAVGVNAVLAMAGAPVCASRLAMTSFSVGASIRIQDSLREGASRFYAEILRLRAILALTDAPRPALFLLDEILQGTNSHDRRVASETVVRSLVERGAVGLVTTHDLALTEIATALGSKAQNAHFEDELVDGKLRFDYHMRAGTVRKGNALELMRSLGFDV